MVGQIEVGIEAFEDAVFLLVDLVDLTLRKHHAAGFVLHMRQRQKALGKDAFGTDLVGRHPRRLVPAHAGRKTHPHALLNRPASA
jgi:hypothetical protein